MDEKTIVEVLRKLNLTTFIEIVAYLDRRGYDRKSANELVEFLQRNELADLDYDHELKFIKIAESNEPVRLENLSIKAKLTIKGKNFIKENTSSINKFLHKWKWQFLVGIPSGLIIAFLAFYFGFENSTNDAFTYTVFVHGEQGQDDIILNQGKVVMDLNNDRRVSEINSSGAAIFNGVPANLDGDSVKIFIEHKEPYRPVDLDRKYALKRSGKAYLKVKLYGSDILYGYVLNHNGTGIDSVRISIRDTSAFTNKQGYYNLEIPLEYQKKFQNVRYEKEGYKPEIRKNTPIHTGQGQDVILNKIDVN